MYFAPALTDEVPECSSLRVPKICTIFGVVGMLRLLAGEHSLKTLNHDLLIDVVDIFINDYSMSLFVLCLKFFYFHPYLFLFICLFIY